MNTTSTQLAPDPNTIKIRAAEFKQFQSWIYAAAGINLADHKQALVMGLLAQRLRHYHLADYGEYFYLLTSGKFPTEAQIAVDLLTTNETHFFREPKHFDVLRQHIIPAHPSGNPLRVWSAASTSGEQPYSIAMTLAATLGERQWEVLASDLSSRILDRARTGHYAEKPGNLPMAVKEPANCPDIENGNSVQ